MFLNNKNNKTIQKFAKLFDIFIYSKPNDRDFLSSSRWRSAMLNPVSDLNDLEIWHLVQCLSHQVLLSPQHTKVNHKESGRLTQRQRQTPAHHQSVCLLAQGRFARVEEGARELQELTDCSCKGSRLLQF